LILTIFFEAGGKVIGMNEERGWKETVLDAGVHFGVRGVCYRRRI